MAVRWSRFLALVIGVLVSSAPLAAQEGALRMASADPMAGKSALTRKGCVTCHSVWGVGGKLGPDLATAGADYSFQQMASMFWNHTPRMVRLLEQRGMEWPVLSEKEMADITSFLYYLKLLDWPGDAARGSVLYREKKCRSCHTLKSGSEQASLSLAEFGSYVSAVSLAQAMWNSGRAMRDAQRQQGIDIPLFQGRDMADLQAFIRGERSGSKTIYLPLPNIERGGVLFRSKGCVRCHIPGSKGTGPDLSRLPLRKSISEICGILWNHSFAMHSVMADQGITLPNLEGSDLADLLAYIYFLHFSRDRGDAARGQAVFREKGCVNCHAADSAGAPHLTEEGRAYDMLKLATSMWNHAPIMYQVMENEVMKWIRLDPDDMQDISRFLQQRASGK